MLTQKINHHRENIQPSSSLPPTRWLESALTARAPAATLGQQLTLKTEGRHSHTAAQKEQWTPALRWLPSATVITGDK